MKCPRCGYVDNPEWRHSRFDFNADYMRFDEALQDPSLRDICMLLMAKRNFEPVHVNGMVYYRRGTGGLWLYRVPAEDFRVPRERKNHGSRVKPLGPNPRASEKLKNMEGMGES